MSNPVPTGGPTPGVDQVINLDLGSTLQLRVRRPSRGDEAQIKRLYVKKLLDAAPAMADSHRIDVARLISAEYDGSALWAEARFEVLLVPRSANGQSQSLGEYAPEHWWFVLKGPEGVETLRVISFDHVSTDEFYRAADALEAALAEKKSDDDLPLRTSTDTAPAPNSA